MTINRVIVSYIWIMVSIFDLKMTDKHSYFALYQDYGKHILFEKANGLET